MALPQLAVVEEPSLRDRIRAEIDFDPKADDERVAGRILYQVKKDALLPLVLLEVRAVRRENVRRHERTLIPRLAARFSGRTTARLTADERLRLLTDLRPSEVGEFRRLPLDLGDGTTVTWGQATVDQLKQRLDMLRQQAQGIGATIERIEDIVGILERTGARCLDDLDI